ncbi:RNase H family protein [Corynebacterium sp. 335C]
MTITAAADGSALGNPGPAGWAWYIDDDNWAAGGWDNSTNNRGELTAVAELLDATAHRVDERLVILCDSQYVINSVTKWMKGWKRKGWKKKDGKPVLNKDLMVRLDEAMQGRDVVFEWVRGHSGHDMNEAADQRARAVATAIQRGATPDEGPGLAGAPTRAPKAASAAAPAPSAGARFAEPEQDGLFDLDDAPAQGPDAGAVLGAHRALGRAVAKLHDGDGRRARSLTRDAVVVPALEEVPEGFGDLKPELAGAVGDTVVTLVRGDGWTVTCTWHAGDPVRLACLHASAAR